MLVPPLLRREAPASFQVAGGGEDPVNGAGWDGAAQLTGVIDQGGPEVEPVAAHSGMGIAHLPTIERDLREMGAYGVGDERLSLRFMALWRGAGGVTPPQCSGCASGRCR